MEMKIYEDYDAMSMAAAEMIIECVKNKPASLFCFATGDTPKLPYQLVIQIAEKEKIDFSKCFLIGLDEWLGIPPDTIGTCHYFLHEYLIQPLRIDPSHFHLFNSMTTDEQEECRKMDALVKEKGGIDFMVVGVGMNGHVGFNEPGTSFDLEAHVESLDATTRTVGTKYFETVVPINKGITLGMKQAIKARTLLMIANGSRKAPVIRKAVEEKETNQFPASFIQSHRNGILMLDSEAAGELTKHYD